MIDVITNAMTWMINVAKDTVEKRTKKNCYGQWAVGSGCTRFWIMTPLHSLTPPSNFCALGIGYWVLGVKSKTIKLTGLKDKGVGKLDVSGVTDGLDAIRIADQRTKRQGHG